MTSKGNLDIAIFGAGIAGLMAAITLTARGHRCRVYERSRQSHEAGMGFILVPEVCECLHEAGVEPPGLPLEMYYCRDSAGRILHEEELPRGSQSIRRRDLIGSLLGALPPSALAFDAELETLEFDADGNVAAARLSSGQFIAADFYIGADGVGSRCRSAL